MTPSRLTIKRKYIPDGDARVTLVDRHTGTPYTRQGGGYDMIGALLGEWLRDTYQDRLQRLPATAGDQLDALHRDARGWTVDGGVRQVQHVAEAVGIVVESTWMSTPAAPRAGFAVHDRHPDFLTSTTHHLIRGYSGVERCVFCEQFRVSAKRICAARQ